MRANMDGYAALAGVPVPVVDATCPASYQLPDGGAMAVDPPPRRVSILPPVFEASPAPPECASPVISSLWLARLRLSRRPRATRINPVARDKWQIRPGPGAACHYPAAGAARLASGVVTGG